MTNCLKRHRCGSRRRDFPPLIFASPAGCWKLAGDNIPGNRAAIPSRPEGALETQTFQASIKAIRPKSNQNQTDSNQKMWQRPMLSIKNSAFLCAHPPSTVLLQMMGLRLKTASLSKVKQGFFHQKNSQFFYRHFYGKSLGNPSKTAKKTAQICPKNTRILVQIKLPQKIGEI